MERSSFVTASMAWSVNFLATALTLFGTAELIATGKRVLVSALMLSALIATFTWLYRPNSAAARRTALLTNGALLVWQSILMGVAIIATRMAAAEFQSAGFAFMVFIVAACAFNLVAILERSSNSFKPKLLRGPA